MKFTETNMHHKTSLYDMNRFRVDLRVIRMYFKHYFHIFGKEVENDHFCCGLCKGFRMLKGCLRFWADWGFFTLKNPQMLNIQIGLSPPIFVQINSNLMRLKAYDQYFSILKKIFTSPHFPLISVAFEEGLRTKKCKNLRFSSFLKYYRNQREMR